MNLTSREQQVEGNLLQIISPSSWIHSGVKNSLWGCLSVLVVSSVLGALDNSVAKVATERSYFLQGFQIHSKKI